MTSWNAHHALYLKESVRAGSRTDVFDASAASTPETFRLRDPLDEFATTDGVLELVRIEDLGAIARRSCADVVTLRAWAEAVALDRRTNAKATAVESAKLNDRLQIWQGAGGLDNRPVFVGFWESVAEVLETPSVTWANTVRDRLGLSLYDPGSRLRKRIDVVAFRYPARLVQRTSRRGGCLLARPTVLDGGLSTAFCTAPAGCGRGSCLDLSGGGSDTPWQEALHPPLNYTADMVWAVGSITSAVPSTLADARAIHLAAVCDANPDFWALAVETDGDL